VESHALAFEARLWRARRLGAQPLLLDVNCCSQRTVTNWDLAALVDVLAEQRDGEGFQLTLVNAPPASQLNARETSYLRHCLLRPGDVRDYRHALIDVTEGSPLSLPAHDPRQVVYLNQNAALALEEAWEPSAVYVLAPILSEALRAANQYGVRVRRLPLYLEAGGGVEEEPPFNLKSNLRLPHYLHLLRAAQFEGGWTQTAIDSAMRRCQLFHLQAGAVKSAERLKQYRKKAWHQPGGGSSSKMPFWCSSSDFVPTPRNQYLGNHTYKGRFMWSQVTMYQEIMKHKKRMHNMRGA